MSHKPGTVIRSGNLFFLCTQKNRWRPVRSTGLGANSLTDEDISGDVVGVVNLSDLEGPEDIRELYEVLTKKAEEKPIRRASTSASSPDLSGLKPYLNYGNRVVQLVLSGQAGEVKSKNGIYEITRDQTSRPRQAIDIGDGQAVTENNHYAVWSDQRVFEGDPKATKAVASWETEPVTSFEVGQKDVVVNGRWLFYISSVAPAFASVQNKGPIQVFLVPNGRAKILLFRAGNAVAFAAGRLTEEETAQDAAEYKKKLDEDMRIGAELQRKMEEAKQAEWSRRAEERARAAEEENRKFQERQEQQDRETRIKTAIDKIAAWKKGYMRMPHPEFFDLRIDSGTPEYREEAKSQIQGLIHFLESKGVKTDSTGRVVQGEWAEYEPEPLRWYQPKTQKEQNIEGHLAAIQRGEDVDFHIRELGFMGLDVNAKGKIATRAEIEANKEWEYDNFYKAGWEAVAKAKAPKASDAEKKYKAVQSQYGVDWIKGYKDHAGALDLWQADYLVSPDTIPRAVKLGLFPKVFSSLKDFQRRSREREIQIYLDGIDAWRYGDKGQQGKESNIRALIYKLQELDYPISDNGQVKDIEDPWAKPEYFSIYPIGGGVWDVQNPLTKEEQKECIQAGGTISVLLHSRRDIPTLEALGMKREGLNMSLVFGPGETEKFQRAYTGLVRLLFLPEGARSSPEDNRQAEIRVLLEAIDDWRSGRKASAGRPATSERYALEARETIRTHAKRLRELGYPISADGLGPADDMPWADTLKEDAPEGANIYEAYAQLPSGKEIPFDGHFDERKDTERCLEKGCTILVYAQTSEDIQQVFRYGMSLAPDIGSRVARITIRPGEQEKLRRLFSGFRTLGLL